jgi:hypothetical protein
VTVETTEVPDSPPKRRKQAPKKKVPPTEYTFQVTYETALFGPPHAVTIRSSTNEWNGTPMTPTEADDRTIWSGKIKSGSSEPVAVEYKLVLDGERWQIGWNQQGVTATSPEGARFDDNNLAWEG